ncbi:DNA polymerase III subunit gamma/tau [Elioraea rosea]|uniref:DNA polymerase III subunit gamma/tau n=1 Tax=Elioraea rosea TaxID=2492390 RepID=UPI001EF6F988|nr:DNA polymerase III subunit gamma/tau [Elioraea rosea]
MKDDHGTGDRGLTGAMAGLFGDTPEDDAPPPAEGPGLFGAAAEAAPATTTSASPAAYRVLARKYRPQDFEALIGQEAMVRTLTNAFAQGRIAHAFMLTGVRGVGKTTTARIIARALNCLGVDGTNDRPTITPCGVCANCRAIAEDRHTDVMEMDAASRTGVDDIREIIEGVRFRPLSARQKVYIIDEVHMLSRNAFNALLKTLEEPPAHVTFIFATTEIRKVPVTVLSRCQRFDLRRIAADRLASHFGAIAEKEGARIEEGALRLIARAADGSVRDGLSLLDQAIVLAGEDTVTEAAVRDMLGLADREAVFDLFEAAMAGRVADALALLAEGNAVGADPGVVIADLLGITHTVTRLKLAPALAERAALSEAERTRGTALAAALSLPQLGRAWQMLLKGGAEVNEAPDRLAAAEMVLIRLAHVADLPTPGDIIRKLTNGEGIAAATPAPRGNPGGGGLRAIAGGGRAVAAASVPISAEPAPGIAITGLADIAALAVARREATLAANIASRVHLVRIEDGLLEIRPDADAPRDLSSKIAALLSEATGRRWTVAISTEAGAPTLAELEHAEALQLRASVEQDPLVRAILEAFPGAVIEAIREAAPPPDTIDPAMDEDEDE